MRKGGREGKGRKDEREKENEGRKEEKRKELRNGEKSRIFAPIRLY